MLDFPDDYAADALLMEEIELLSEVMIMATASDHTLSGQQLDDLLGLAEVDELAATG